MKKFISVLMALVMALSLTTMAWGADTTVVDATTDAQIAAALKDTTTAELVINLPATTGSDVFTIEIYGRSTVNTAIKSVTINGTDKTKVQFSNLQVNVALLEKFTIDNCEILHMATKSWGHLVFGDGQADGVYTVSNCLFNGVGTQGIYFNPKHTATYVVENCTFTGDFGSEGAVVVQNGDGTEASSVPSSLTVSGNTFAVTKGEDVAVWFKDSDLDVTSQVPASALVNNAEQFKAAAAAADAGETIKLMANVDLTSTPVEITNPVTIDDNGKTLTGLAAGSDITTDANGKITGGTFETLPDESLLADGVTFVGNTVTVPAKKSTSYQGLYAKDTNAPLVDAVVVDIVVTPAKAVKYNKTTGYIDELGNVEYVNITGDGTYYVFVSTLAEADVVLYKDAAEKQIMFYLAAINEPYYVEGVAFANFGEKCGQVDYDEDDGYDKTLKYFTVKGVDFFDVFEEVEAGAYYDANVLYNGKLVPVVSLGVDKVAHTAVYTTKNGVVESVECGACGLKAVKAANVLSLPKGADVVAGETVWYWPVATAGTTTTDKTVTSAETFDAGIAMYVGMSVMAAAGSAVVIGKKRED